MMMKTENRYAGHPDAEAPHACACGHLAVDHHGVDPEDGCMAVASHKLPQCPCRKTCPEVVAA